MFKYIYALIVILGVGTIMGASPNKSVYNQNRENVEKVLIKEKVVQFGQNLKVIGIPVTELQPEYYYQKSKGDNSGIRDDDYLARKIAEEIAKKLAELGIRPSGPDNSNPRNQLINKVQALVDKRCASCHSGDNPDAGYSFVDKNHAIKLTDKNENLTEPEIAWLMFSEVLEGKMPKNGVKLTDEENEVFHELAKLLTREQQSKSK